MLRRKFAVIKLWPDLKTAEDECIARLKITARSLGLECVEVDSFARLMDGSQRQLTQDDIDFVLSLHFETPKSYDIFSFVALWNPLQFFQEWGYRKFTRNLLTHDDFLSCSSPWADDHVKRAFASRSTRLPPALHLYHSLSEPILNPTTGEGKLFYAGINWERVTQRPQRHAKLLKLLDDTGNLRIYGPKTFQGVDVWAGYKSYRGPIPFDGVSMIRLIHEAGISLVLSSEAHRQSELMSSRLFESLAAGAVILCDDNAFARRFFGETLLYIDTTLDASETFLQLQSHLKWIRSQPDAARELATKAQQIFLREFSLDRCLQNIYEEFPVRKKEVERLYAPGVTERITVLLLMPEFDPDVLEKHLTSCRAQKAVDIRPVLVLDEWDFQCFEGKIRSELDKFAIPVRISTLTFFERYADGRIKSRKRLGKVIHEAMRYCEDAYFCIVGPHERLFSDHLCSLVRALQDCDEAGLAWADAVQFRREDKQEYAEVSDAPGESAGAPDGPIEFGRFLFRKSKLPSGLETILPYLDALPIALLAGLSHSVRSTRCTLLTEVQHPFVTQLAKEARPGEEREIIKDYSPSFFRTGISSSDHSDVLSLSIDRLTLQQKTKLAVELAHSVPFPGFLKKLGFGLYRLWLRRTNPS